MAAPASVEFIGLCRAQLVLLAQGFGSTFGAVYLAEGWSEGRATRWLPLVVYPDVAAQGRALEPGLIVPPVARRSKRMVRRDLRQANLPSSMPDSEMDFSDVDFLGRDGLGRDGDDDWGDNLVDDLDPDIQQAIDGLRPSVDLPRPPARSTRRTSGKVPRPRQPQFEATAPDSPQSDSPQSDSHQIVLPLQQDGQVLGVLISRRDRPWSSLDYAQLEQIAQTLSMGCLLDRRLQWVQERYQRQELLQEQRQDILDNWIHQLRNPLMALRTFGKLLLRRLQPQDPNRSTVEGLIREGDRIESLLVQMSRMIDSWMDELPEAAPGPTERSPLPLSLGPAPESSGSPLLLPPSPLGDRLTAVPCSVLLLLRPLIESFSLLAQEKAQILDLSVAGAATVLAEPGALQEVLGNLIENALKYSGDGSHIWVQLAIDGGRQWVRVIDNGPGIPAADLGQIFERHYRGVQSRGDKPGSGLGLAIARGFVEQMGGELRVISPVDWSGQWAGLGGRRRGPGTCFELSLCLAPSDRQ